MVSLVGVGTCMAGDQGPETGAGASQTFEARDMMKAKEGTEYSIVQYHNLLLPVCSLSGLVHLPGHLPGHKCQVWGIR